MDGNPYSALIESLSNHLLGRQVAPWRIGRISGLSPVSVNLGGHRLSGNDLLRNPYLGEIEVGDQVVLLQPQDGQQYVLICKVV